MDTPWRKAVTVDAIFDALTVLAGMSCARVQTADFILIDVKVLIEQI